MRYRGNKDKLLLIFVVGILFFWSNGFNLRLFELSDRYQVLNLTAHFLLLFFSSIRFLAVNKRTLFNNKYFMYLFLMMAAVMWPTFVNLVFVNGIDFVEVLRSSFGYFGLLIFIVLVSYPTSEQFVARLNSWIYVIVTLNIIALIFVSTNPAFAESMLINTLSRYGRIRLMISAAIGWLPHFYFFYTLIMCKKEVTVRGLYKYLAILIIYIWYFVALDMTRRTILSLIVVAVLFYFVNTTIKTKVTILFVAALLLPVLWLSVPQFEMIVDVIVNSYVSSRSEYEGEEGNVGIRMAGIEYYFDMLANSGYMGIGLYSNRLPTYDPYTHGVSLFRYNPSDHGIFAVVYEYGVFGVVLTLYLLFTIFRDLKIINKYGSQENKKVAMAAVLFLTFNIIALLQIFWKPALSIWTGILFFMIWRMRLSVTRVQAGGLQPVEAGR